MHGQANQSALLTQTAHTKTCVLSRSSCVQGFHEKPRVRSWLGRSLRFWRWSVLKVQIAVRFHALRLFCYLLVTGVDILGSSVVSILVFVVQVNLQSLGSDGAML